MKQHIFFLPNGSQPRGQKGAIPVTDFIADVLELGIICKGSYVSIGKHLIHSINFLKSPTMDSFPSVELFEQPYEGIGEINGDGIRVGVL